jgi:hypothetical protein
MSYTTRIAASLVGISIAAIPVAALTIKNNSDKEISVGVDNGTDEAVYKIAPGTSVDVKESCADGCAVTGPWGFSRLVSQNDAIDTDGTSLVTDMTATPAAPSLIPENPLEAAAASGTTDVAKTPTVETPAVEKPAVEQPARRRRVVKKPTAQASKGPSAGSLEMLLTGPGK